MPVEDAYSIPFDIRKGLTCRNRTRRKSVPARDVEYGLRSFDANPVQPSYAEIVQHAVHEVRSLVGDKSLKEVLASGLEQPGTWADPVKQQGFPFR